MQTGINAYGTKRKKVFSEKFMKLYWSDLRWYPMIIVPIIGTFLFGIYPFILTVVGSFFDYGMKEFAGFNNYIALLRDWKFLNSIKNTLILWVMVMPIHVIFTFIVASLLNSVKSLGGFYKSLFLFPMIISTVGAVLIFRFMFLSTESGLINYIISMLGVAPIPWFLEGSWARVVVVILNLWLGSGFGIILFLAALQSISKELYEAAEIDGASGFQSWRYVTIPNLSGVFKFMLITGTISSFSRFADVYSLSMGLASEQGPSGVYDTIAVFILRNMNPSFQTYGNYTKGLAASVVLFFLTIAMTSTNFMLLYRNTKKNRR